MNIQTDGRKRRPVNKRVMLTMFVLLIVSILVGPAQSASNLALYKYAPASIGQGNNMNYTLSFNNSNDTASNVILNDTLPLNVSFISASNGGTYDSSTRNVTWNIGDVLPFTSDSRNVTVSIPSSVPVGTVITNTASISTTTPDTNYNDNSASANTTVITLGPNLVLYKYAPASIGPGNNMIYRLYFYNSGTDTASSAVLIDALPVNVNFISASNGGTYDSGTNSVTWNLGDVLPFTSDSRNVTVSIPGSVPVGTVITNTASISTTTPETNYNDNSASAQTTVRIPAPNLALYKYAPVGVVQGNNIVYTLSFYNFGDGIATNTVLIDTLPSNMNFISASNGGTYNSNTNSVTWNRGDVLPFTSDSRTVSVNIPGSVPVGTVITNTASISTTTPETNYNDNSASAQTTVTSSTFPANVGVEPSYANSGGYPPSVYYGSPVTFSYHSCGTASAVHITIHVDGFSDITGSMTGGPPDWTFTVTPNPLHGLATITYTITGCGEQTPVVFNIYLDPAGYIYDVTTGQRIAGATVTLQRFNTSTASWENVPTGQMPSIMIPDTNPLITGIDGQYQWDTLPGTYRVNVTAPGYNPADSRVVTVPPPVTDLHVGLIPLSRAHVKGSISGMKFNDLNGNVIKEPGEPGLANWTITLTNQSGNTVNTMTEINGNYSFTNLSDGNYTVGEIQKPGWIQIAPALSTNGSATYKVNISGGNQVVGKDFGNFKLGEVHGMKWEDLNANGIKDANETGLAGWNITINGTDTITGERVNITTATDANGNYSFMNLTAGTYVISEKSTCKLKDDDIKDDHKEKDNKHDHKEKSSICWVQTWPATGNYTVNITSGAVITGLDFGNFKRGKITGGGDIPANGKNKTTFELDAQYPDDKATAQGSVEYLDQAKKLEIESIKINTVATTMDGKKGVITGLAMVNEKGSYYFEAYVEDNGEPGKGKDVFRISLPTYPYSNGAILSDGNIQIDS